MGRPTRSVTSRNASMYTLGVSACTRSRFECGFRIPRSVLNVTSKVFLSGMTPDCNGLFGERDDRIDLRRAARRQDARRQGDERQEGRDGRQHERIGGPDAEQLALEAFAQP